MQLSLLFLKVGFGFWLISDLPTSGWSELPNFWFSVFLGFHISTLRANLYLSLKTRLNGRFSELVALKSEFSDPKWNLLGSFSDSWANFHLWKVVLQSYIQLETWQFQLLESFGLLAWDSNMAAYQQFLKHIYWNFMESGISGIRIWLDLWLSASNELDKQYLWQNPLEIDPLRQSWKYRISLHMRWYERP